MKIKFNKYLLATKSFPLEFDSKDSEGNMTSDIEDAMLYNTEKDVENELGNFDEPELFQTLKVNVTYEF